MGCEMCVRDRTTLTGYLAVLSSRRKGEGGAGRGGGGEAPARTYFGEACFESLWSRRHFLLGVPSREAFLICRLSVLLPPPTTAIS